MITFFGILFGLLIVNALLLIFSVNGALERFKKPIQKISDLRVTKLLPSEYDEAEYKKAV